MKKQIAITVFIFLFFGISAFSQEFRGQEAAKRVDGADFIYYRNADDNPEYIRLSPGHEVDMSKMDAWLRKACQLDGRVSWELIGTEHDKLGQVHYRYRQLWDQVPLRDAIFIVHTFENKIFSVNGKIYRQVNVLNNAVMAAADALNYALAYVNADEYKWELPAEEAFLKEFTADESATYFPEGEQVLVQVQGHEYKHAWKYDVYAHSPMSRQYIFVDAQTGQVLLTLNRIHNTDVPGSAVTKYSNTRSITTDSTAPGSYRLREAGRGNGIGTYDMNTGTNYGNAADFTDSDNTWNNVNAQQDEIAGDAHWGTEMTYDYYWLEHGRNSIDNNGFALKSYVHYDANYANAFWNGQYMTYGDGNGTYSPFTTLDICAHEVTHGLTELTANLDYAVESGALSEGFSDIFGCAVEFYARPPQAANWFMGEDIGGSLRKINDPNLTGNPDTYLGNYWDPGQEVHQNSTVCSHWFYRLSQGGNGTNDNGHAYSVVGQGLDKAADIAFRVLTVYLISTSDYADARFYSIIAAGDLFGGCSPEVEATADAWYAVGVGGVYSPVVTPDFVTDYTSLCQAPATIQFTNTTVNANTYLWNFGDGTTSTATNPSHIYTSTGDYNVKLVAYGGTCGTDSIIKTNHISIDAGNTALMSMPSSGAAPSQTCCTGKLYDSGGTGSYSNNTNGRVTIAPTGATNIVLSFVSFNLESGYDYLYIYDGPSTASPLIGQYDGTTLPNGGMITSSGGSITLRQYTDQGVVASGFEVNWQCNYPNAAPLANFVADVTQTCTGLVQFTDLSSNVPNTWLWDFGDGTNSNQQNPLHAYAANGTYTVTLTSGNSFGSNIHTKTSYISVSMPAAPTSSPQTICDNTSAMLTASGSGTLLWYGVPVGGTPLDTGSVFNTPLLFASSTYYVEDQHIGATYYGGKATNGGTGGYFTNTNQHGLYFNCTQECKLVSVKVYADGAGNRTITLIDSAGTPLMSGTYNMPDGESRVTLNWNLPVKNNMRLMGPGSPDLYRNGVQGGPNLGYPFDIGGKVSIFKSTAGSPNHEAYYYYFYDWEIKDPTCISARIPVEVTVLTCSSTEDIPGVSNIVIAPNPASEQLNITFTGTEGGILDLHLYDIMGREVVNRSVLRHAGLNAETLDVRGFAPGVYMLKLTDGSAQHFTRIVVK